MKEESPSLVLFSVQTGHEVKVYSGLDQLSGRDGRISPLSVEPLPGAPRGAHRGPYEK